MEKIVTETGELVLKRTEFMQWTMNTTYSSMIIIALIDQQSLTGAWEKAIADYLKALYKSRPLHRLQILDLLTETGIEGITNHAFDLAAKLILNSKQ